MKSKNLSVYANKNINLSDYLLQLFNETARGVTYWRKNKNRKCYKCSKYGHLAKDCHKVCNLCDNIHNSTICTYGLSKLYKAILRTLQAGNVKDPEKIMSKIETKKLEIKAYLLERKLVETREKERTVTTCGFSYLVGDEENTEEDDEIIDNDDDEFTVTTEENTPLKKIFDKVGEQIAAVDKMKTEFLKQEKVKPIFVTNINKYGCYKYSYEKNEVGWKESKKCLELNEELSKLKIQMIKQKRKLSEMEYAVKFKKEKEALENEKKILNKEVNTIKEEIRDLIEEKNRYIQEYKERANKKLDLRFKKLEDKQNRIDKAFENLKKKKINYYKDLEKKREKTHMEKMEQKARNIPDHAWKEIKHQKGEFATELRKAKKRNEERDWKRFKAVARRAEYEARKRERGSIFMSGYFH